MIGSVSRLGKAPVFVFSGRKPTSGDGSSIDAEREKTMSKIKPGGDETQLATVKECSNEVPPPKPAVRFRFVFSGRKPTSGDGCSIDKEREKTMFKIKSGGDEEQLASVKECSNGVPPPKPAVRFVYSRRKPTSGDGCIIDKEREKTMSKIKSGGDEAQLASVKECSNEVPPAPPKPAVQSDVGSSRPKRGASKSSLGDTMMKKEKFLASLSWKEIEEDFMKITNQRPSRRPKKRSKIVQKEIDNICPGLHVAEVTVDMYKVPDSDRKKKTRRRHPNPNPNPSD